MDRVNQLRNRGFLLASAALYLSALKTASARKARHAVSEAPLPPRDETRRLIVNHREDQENFLKESETATKLDEAVLYVPWDSSMEEVEARLKRTLARSISPQEKEKRLKAEGAAQDGFAFFSPDRNEEYSASRLVHQLPVQYDEYDGESRVIAVRANNATLLQKASDDVKAIKARQAAELALRQANSGVQRQLRHVLHAAENAKAVAEEAERLAMRKERAPLIRDEVIASSGIAPKDGFSKRVKAIWGAVKKTLQKMRTCTREEHIGEGNGGCDAAYYYQEPNATKSVPMFNSREYADMARYLWCEYTAAGIDNNGYYFPFFENDRYWLDRLLVQESRWLDAFNCRHGGPMYAFLHNGRDTSHLSGRPQHWEMCSAKALEHCRDGLEEAAAGAEINVRVQRPDGASVDLANVKPSELVAAYNARVGEKDAVWQFFKDGTDGEPLCREDIEDGDVLFAVRDEAPHPLEWSQDAEEEIKGLEQRELEELFWSYREAERVTKDVIREHWE